jgi:hypothetical protein
MRLMFCDFPQPLIDALFVENLSVDSLFRLRVVDQGSTRLTPEVLSHSRKTRAKIIAIIHSPSILDIYMTNRT